MLSADGVGQMVSIALTADMINIATSLTASSSNVTGVDVRHRLLLARYLTPPNCPLLLGFSVSF